MIRLGFRNLHVQGCAGLVKKLCLLAVLACGSAVFANQEIHLHTQDLGGVYTQSWYGHFLRPSGAQGGIIYIIGEGKLGDFQGILDLNCRQAHFSYWVTSAGFIKGLS